MYQVDKLHDQVERLERELSRWTDEWKAHGRELGDGHSTMNRRDLAFLRGQVNKLKRLQRTVEKAVADSAAAVENHKAKW